jgi:hypothetical protein
VTLDEARKKLTEREFEFLEAMLAKDDLKLRTFGDDAVLLAKNVEYKILDAGGIGSGPTQVEGAGTQLKLFEDPVEDPSDEPPAQQELSTPPEHCSKEDFDERGGARPVEIPPVPGASKLIPGSGDLDGLESKTGDGPVLGEMTRGRDILDQNIVAHGVPFGKGDVIRGDRVMFRATGGIHRVRGVDRTTDPHTIKIEVFGKTMDVSREMVNKVAPNGYNPRWHRRRVRPQARYRQPEKYAEPPPRDGYDPSDHSS